MKSIVLGGGCFWCIEAVFQQVKGIERVVSGYSGGDLKNPTYENHGTHAEVVQLTYNPEIVSLEKLLEIFFSIHDPTTLDRQGNDIGQQYRSIILCDNHADIDTARRVIDSVKELWHNPIITEVSLLDVFWPAEDYHQNYYNNNKSTGYCQVVINPKLDKLRKHFTNLLRN